MVWTGSTRQSLKWTTTSLAEVRLVLKAWIHPLCISSKSAVTVQFTENGCMTTTMTLPEHKLEESPNSRCIHVKDWSITASTNPISNASEVNALQSYLGFPLPEMTFGNNYLLLEHHPSAWSYSFSAPRALKLVKNGELQEGDGGVKVGHADAWLKSRCDTIH
jgi:hypothetical protein